MDDNRETIREIVIRIDRVQTAQYKKDGRRCFQISRPVSITIDGEQLEHVTSFDFHADMNSIPTMKIEKHAY